ncbi:MAG TPA: cell division protein ZapE [Trueperaceae bacterium]
MPRTLSVSDLQAPAAPSARDLRPPKRFANASFENYLPQHPTQSQARERVREFVAARRRTSGRSNPLFGWFGRRHDPGSGLYLDGGFGVGKTHLLAAAYAEADTPEKRYLSFQQLVYVIGAMGMAAAKEEFASTEILCIDEFELDDPGNTLIVKTFLAAAFERGTRVVTTSNTPPEAQGQGRFNAEDFRREIQSLSEGFEVVPVDGPDFRARHAGGEWLTQRQLLDLEASEPSPAPRLSLTWDELFVALRAHHPSRIGGLLEQVGSVYLHGARTIPDQNDALRFVHFVDQLYDRALLLRVSGDGPIVEVFDPSYRESAYAKKHHRCASRLTELLAEAAQPGQDVEAVALAS